MHNALAAGACVVSAAVSMLALEVLRHGAEPLGLVDRPSERKHHAGHVPLVGGMAIFLGIVAGAWWRGYLETHPQLRVILATAAVLVLLGALDDRFHLSVRVRLLVQVSVTVLAIAGTGIYVRTLGDLFGAELNLGWAGVPFTVFAVIGLLNAFNMMDGIDGLLGSLCLIGVGAAWLLDGFRGASGFQGIALLIVAAVLPFLVRNLGPARYKIFMGDAGSMVTGYLLAWMLIQIGQTLPARNPPADALWCVALPLMDIVAVTCRRVRQGKSPFRPDRGHIHHLLLAAGLAPRAALACLVGLAVILVLLGVFVHTFGNTTSLLVFCGLTVVYATVTNVVWMWQQGMARVVISSKRTTMRLLKKARHGRLHEIKTTLDMAEQTPIFPAMKEKSRE